MRTITYAEAIREALAEEMHRDENVFLLGEDIELGITFQVTKGLIDQFGPQRVRDTPISEEVIVGAAVGAALTGKRPVPEIQFADFVTLAMDQLINQAAKLRYMTGGQARVPLVVRLPMGFLGSFAAQHSQSVYTWFINVPGLRVVTPATPADAKGLLKTAIRDDNPVLFCEHKSLYKKKGEVPDRELLIPFGEAAVRREGTDVTIVAIAYMVHVALEVAEDLAQEGISCSVIDPRTLSPLDIETIVEDVKRTSRLVIVEEAPVFGGFSAEISAGVSERAIQYLDGPIVRIGARHTPIPYHPQLEREVLPKAEEIKQAVYTLLRYEW